VSGHTTRVRTHGFRRTWELLLRQGVIEQGLATAMTQLPSAAVRQVALEHMYKLLALLAPHPR
jgi:hypothetical protein